MVLPRKFPLLLALLCACTPHPDASAPDGRDDPAFRDGDLGDVTDCQALQTLGFVNASDAETLKGHGVHTQAANHIEATRAGADQTLGTADDVVFASLFEVDDVPYVGPVAMDQLLAVGAGLCDGVSEPEPPAHCPTDEVLALVNDPSTDVPTLQDAGLHTQAANHVVTHRNGDDGIAGTQDDLLFASLEELDAVPYVGPVAMEQLLTWGESRCGVAEVVFSPQSYYDSHLVRTEELIDGAEHSIDVAMYSFRDSLVLDALARAVDRGVTVRFLFDTASVDRLDPAGTRSAALEDLGIEVRWVNKIQHHKFALIDGPRDDLSRADTAVLATGSGNWSYGAATRFDENMVVVQGDARLALLFQQEFDLLWDHSREVVWNEEIAPIGSIGVTDEDIAAASGSDAVFTSANFRVYDSATYGWTFARRRGHSHARDAIVELIASADESVWIASGHLRSRQIAEAILDKAHDPDVDIRVYLDGQEYTSSWYFGTEVDDYEACHAEASTHSQIEDCEDQGLHFGYALHQAGVDLRYKYYAYRWDYHYADQMHHKYVVVDGEVVATGSYNFSNNAEYDTFENVVLLDAARYPELVDAFEANFDAIWLTGDGLYDDQLDAVQNGAGPIDLVFDPMALNWPEITALKAAIRDACPEVDSDAYREDPVAHQQCPR